MVASKLASDLSCQCTLFTKMHALLFPVSLTIYLEELDAVMVDEDYLVLTRPIETNDIT